jgi:hypothetical protein
MAEHADSGCKLAKDDESTGHSDDTAATNSIAVQANTRTHLRTAAASRRRQLRTWDCRDPMAASRHTERAAVFSLRREAPHRPRTADARPATTLGGRRVNSLRLIVAFVFGAAAVLAGATPATAHPGPISQAPPPSAQPSCSFTLSAPQVTEVPGGAKMATATYAANSCSGNAQPVFATVCVVPPNGPSQCFKNYGWLVAQVYVASPSTSGEFTATGLGCWQAGSTEFTCAPDGPVRATL